MALLATAMFHENAYHRVCGLNYDRNRLRFVIRYETYVNENSRRSNEQIMSESEIMIGPKEILASCRADALAESEKHAGAIRKAAEKEFKAATADGGKPVVRGRTVTLDKLVIDERNRWVAARQAELYDKKAAEFRKSIEGKAIIPLAYALMKGLDEFRNAIDA